MPQTLMRTVRAFCLPWLMCAALGAQGGDGGGSQKHVADVEQVGVRRAVIGLGKEDPPRLMQWQSGQGQVVFLKHVCGGDQKMPTEEFEQHPGAHLLRSFAALKPSEGNQ